MREQCTQITNTCMCDPNTSAYLLAIRCVESDHNKEIRNIEDYEI